MYPMKTLISSIVALFFACNAWAISISDFSDHNKYRSVKISPSGKYLAISRFQDGETDLVIVDTKTMKAVNQLYFRRKEEIGTLYWVNDERLVFKIFVKHPSQENPVYYGELFSVNVDNTKPKMIFGSRIILTKPKTSRERKIYENHIAMRSSWANIVNLLPNDEKHILISAKSYKRSSPARLYKLNVYTAAISPVTEEPIANSSIFSDRDGNLKLAIGYNSKDQKEVYHYNTAKNEWTQTTNLEHAGDFYPLTFNDKTNQLTYLDNIDHDKTSLYRADMATGKRQIIYTNPKYDIDWVSIDDESTTLFGLKILEQYPKYYFPDLNQPLQRLYKQLTESFPGRNVSIDSNTRDMNQFVVRVSSDREATTWYLFNKEKNDAKFIASSTKRLPAQQMQSMMAFEFKARDQKEINGYITFPSVADKKNLPAVVLVHGGPFGVQDKWAFNKEVQLLAAHGYAVVQINYRGSGGYGTKFVTSGYRHWGDSIQHDIIDGTRFLIDHNIINKERVCIMGASFGGYSAVRAPMMSKDIFKCAIASSGVYDLISFTKDSDIEKQLWGKSFLERTVGLDQYQLQGYSPQHTIENLKVPLLLTHGELDERAPYSQAKAFYKALKKANNKVTWVTYDEEGHGIYNQENRLDYYQKVINFLQKHNPI